MFRATQNIQTMFGQVQSRNAVMAVSMNGNAMVVINEAAAADEVEEIEELISSLVCLRCGSPNSPVVFPPSL